MLVRGVNFLAILKQLANQFPRFGLRGQELRDGIYRRPLLPEKFFRLPDGSLTSVYDLTEEGRLSREGLADYIFDRD